MDNSKKRKRAEENEGDCKDLTPPLPLKKKAKRAKKVAASSVSDTTPRVCNLHKKDLCARGFTDIRDWLSRDGHLNVGRGNILRIQDEKTGQWTSWPPVGSPLANPFVVDIPDKVLRNGQVKPGKKKDGTREEVLVKFTNHVRTELRLGRVNLQELRAAKELGCWCHPADCHAHLWVKVANASDESLARFIATGVF